MRLSSFCLLPLMILLYLNQPHLPRRKPGGTRSRTAVTLTKGYSCSSKSSMPFTPCTKLTGISCLRRRVHKPAHCPRSHLLYPVKCRESPSLTGVGRWLLPYTLRSFLRCGDTCAIFEFPVLGSVEFVSDLLFSTLHPRCSSSSVPPL